MISAAQGQTTWYVDDDAPGDLLSGDPTVSDPFEDGSTARPFDAIQEGIDAAVNGDTVLVLNGTYIGPGNRDIEFGGKLITVRSENGPDICIIDCEAGDANYHRAFLFQSGEDAGAVLEDLTIRNGYEEWGGANRQSRSDCERTDYIRESVGAAPRNLESGALSVATCIQCRFARTGLRNQRHH